jgi:hypothetical protein
MNCIDCENHLVINDRDPNDWFCDDDKAVVCTLTKNPKHKPDSKYLSERSQYKSVTVACRPYNIRKESEQPEWCPIKGDL